MTYRREETVWIPESDLDGMSVDTLAVRAGQIRTDQLEHSDAIFPTSSFVYGQRRPGGGPVRRGGAR